MNEHTHICQCCFEVFGGCDCPHLWLKYSTCPDCRLKETFYEATKHWKVIPRCKDAA